MESMNQKSDQEPCQAVRTSDSMPNGKNKALWKRVFDYVGRPKKASDLTHAQFEELEKKRSPQKARIQTRFY